MIIREATDADRTFIFSLSPTLVKEAKLPWHTSEVESQFQDRYIEESVYATDGRQIVYIAEKDSVALGFIQVVQSKDEISQEICSRVPLLAVTKEAQGMGVGRRLMEEAQMWAKTNGHRLLQLEVFYNNDQARGFYEKQGFVNETIIMVKPLDG